MAQAESTHNVVSASCGGGDVAGDQNVAAMAPCSPESSLYMTTGMSEAQIKATIQKSKDHGWSELANVGRTGQVGGAAGSLSKLDAIAWKDLKQKHPSLFRDDVKVTLGQIIAKGGQGKIYEAEVVILNARVSQRYVAKVFKKNSISLIGFQRQWPMVGDRPYSHLNGHPVFVESALYRTKIDYGVFLEDGRFAFLIRRCWGDLRALIDLKLKNQNSQSLGPPFSDLEALQIMYHIAWGVYGLHLKGALHRDLKAANVLIKIEDENFKEGDALKVGENCEAWVTDYETSMLVQGTGFWRAPEVLRELQKPGQCDQNATIWTEKVDVYSYAMTCYEILTGLVPFKGYYKSDWDRIIVHRERPHVPDYVHPDLEDLMERCWHADPSKRPTFLTICHDLKSIESDFKSMIYGLMDEGPGSLDRLDGDLHRMSQIRSAERELSALMRH